MITKVSFKKRLINWDALVRLGSDFFLPWLGSANLGSDTSLLDTYFLYTSSINKDKQSNNLDIKPSLSWSYSKNIHLAFSSTEPRSKIDKPITKSWQKKTKLFFYNFKALKPETCAFFPSYNQTIGEWKLYYSGHLSIN